MSCGVGRRHSSDSVLLWLWCKLAAAALIQPLAWEHPYAVGAALQRPKKKKFFLIKKKEKRKCYCLMPAIQKQAAGQIRLTGCSWPTPALQYKKLSSSLEVPLQLG